MGFCRHAHTCQVWVAPPNTSPRMGEVPITRQFYDCTPDATRAANSPSPQPPPFWGKSRSLVNSTTVHPTLHPTLPAPPTVPLPSLPHSGGGVDHLSILRLYAPPVGVFQF